MTLRCASPQSRTAAFNSCFINREYSRAGPDIRKSGPIGIRGLSCRGATERYPAQSTAFLVLALVLAHDYHPYCLSTPCSPISHLFTLAADLGDLAAGPDAARHPDVSFLRVRIALTTFARREQRRTSRRHSDLSSLPVRGHDYDLLTWTTVSESGHRGVRRWISAFSRSQLEGMEVAKLFLSWPVATRRECFSHS